MVALTVKGRVFPGDRVFKVYDGKLMESAKAMYSTGAPVRRFGVRAVVRAAVGQPLYLSFTDEYGNVAEAETEFMGQEAMKRPLTKETLMKQIGRLGTSIFTLRELKAEISGHVMVPVSELNEVRRKCVEQLEKMRLADFQAAADKARAEAAAAVRAGLANFYSVIEKTASENIRSRNRGETGITVVADDLAKLSAALEGGADRIVFGGENYRHEAITLPMYEMAVKLAKTAGGKVVFNTPRIIRDGELDAFHRWLENIRDMGADGISIHNIGSLYAARMMTDLPVEADFSLISYNIETLRHFQELGISRAVLSPELNMTQLAELAGQSPVPVECLAEGNLELMVSEYCCTGSFLGGLDKGSCGAPCVNSGKSFFLKDRKDIKFPLVMDQYCHMHLLNGSRLSMLPHAMKFRQLGISSLRIDGRYMDEGQLRKTVRNYRKYMAYPAELTEAEKKVVQQLEGENITRGHYFRGVL